MKDWGKEIIDRCVPLAEQLDYANKTTRHTNAVESAREKLDLPNATPSGKILHEIQEKFNGSYFDFVMDLSSKYASDARGRERRNDSHMDLQLQAEMSLERQKQIESTDQISFDEFREAYISQEASRIYLTQKN
jgi:glutamate--cysteine ligase